MDTVYTALVFPLLLLIGQTLVASGQHRLNMRMDEGQAKTDVKRAAEAEWRDAVTTHMQRQDEHMALMTSSLQSTMRATLMHNAEKLYRAGRIGDTQLRALLDQGAIALEGYQRIWEHYAAGTCGHRI